MYLRRNKHEKEKKKSYHLDRLHDGCFCDYSASDYCDDFDVV